jgi:DNA-directed RNA polymerase subunit L
VTSKDIIICDENGTEYSKEFHKKIFPADPVTKDHVLITKLKPNFNNNFEHIHVEFLARKGIAKMHARWSPISTCTFFNLHDDAKVKTEKKRLEDELSKSSNMTDKEKRAALNKFDTLDMHRFFIENEFGEPCAFRFDVESECRLSPTEIFMEGISVLKEKVAGIAKKAVFEPIDEASNLYAINVSEEDHTIGNLFQVTIFNEYVRHNKIVDFVGYFQPHPLENNIVFKIRFFDDATPVQFKGFLEDVADVATKELDRVIKSWKKAATVYADADADEDA